MNKLSLTKETLRALEAQQSLNVAGGFFHATGLPPTTACPTMLCTGTACNTIITCRC